MSPIDPRRVKRATLREAMLRLAHERGPGKAVDPMEVAVAVVGKDEKVWRRLMKPLKDEAQRLAKKGEIVVLRKGKPQNPDAIRGLWRFRMLAEGEPVPTFAAEVEEIDEDLVDEDDLDDVSDLDDDEDERDR